MPNYTRKLDKVGDVFTLAEWMEMREDMCLPCDGGGNWVKDGMRSEGVGFWGDDDLWGEAPSDATHVVWYNK